MLDDARVLVVDAFDGSAVVSGAGLDEVLARWEAELFRAKPRPPRPVEPTPRKPSPAPGEPETFKDEEGRTVGFSTGTITVTAGGGASIEWPAAVPRNIPAVMVELPPLPEVPLALAAAGFSKWVRLVGQHGLVSLALCRREEQGFTLVGQGIVDLVDPTTIEAELDAADAQERAFHAATPELPAPWDQDFAASALVSYGLVDAVGRQRAPARVRGGQWSGGFDAGSLDGDQLEWVVCRQRRLR
ncbi:MAG: hypothetical protein HY744_34425 [Deltaproteobacteria bacterium]|nr:hypothetical protein [Deltaproteobacteria bacterium]